MKRLVWVAISAMLVSGASLGLLAALAPSAGSQQGTAIRKDVDLVSIYFTVRDGQKRLVTEMEQDRFRVFEENKEQKITHFARHSDVMLNLGVLIDTSTKVPGLLGAEADAAVEFLQRVMRRKDLGFVVSVDSRVNTLQVPTGELQALVEKADSIRDRGTWSAGRPPLRLPPIITGPFPTPGAGPGMGNPMREARIFDAVRVSVSRYLKQEVGRKAVVILALADDAKSESTVEDALVALQGSDVIAYVLQFQHDEGDDCDITHIFRSGSGRLGRVAEETGGRVLDVRGRKKLREAFLEIAEELHNQYSLGYSPQNQKWDGSFRKVQIKVRDGNYKVQARKGYYAVAAGGDASGKKQD